MGRLCTCEALVLKTYDVGEADRFCILLTATKGSLPICAKGVRRGGSRWGAALQSFQHVSVDLSLSAAGWYLRSAECLSSYDPLRRDLQKFLLAGFGTELLLHFLEDEHPDEPVFRLAQEYFFCISLRADPLFFSSFSLSLLSLLGLLPDFALRALPGKPSSREMHSLSKSAHAHLSSTLPFRERVKMPLALSARRELQHLSERLLQDHLSFPLRSSVVAGALGSIPISSKFGRASY